MKYLLLKDKRRRVLYKAFEKQRKFMQAFLVNVFIPMDTRIVTYRTLIELPRDSSITRLRNRCFLTNRSRSIYKTFGISRLMFRKFV